MFRETILEEMNFIWRYPTVSIYMTLGMTFGVLFGICQINQSCLIGNKYLLLALSFMVSSGTGVIGALSGILIGRIFAGLPFFHFLEF